MDAEPGLESLKWKLSRDAESHSFRYEARKLRLSYTEQLREEPVYRVYLWIESDDVVVLAWIEVADDAPPYGFDDWLDPI
jgi:hypothetical protein